MSGATFETLLALDARLVRKGHHPLTPWWRSTLERFYGHPTARTLVARVGRGGAKSFTSVRVSLNETLFGSWTVPPGEVHFWAYASTSISEARQRLRLIEQCLTDLGVAYDRSGEEIVLRDLPRGWRVFAATIGSVSGFRCFGRSLDELAKWTGADGAANPAAEVAASMTAMAVSHPGARALLISSPLGEGDYHATRFALGDTEHQITAYAPTWIANPSISKEQTERDEPDARVHAREYAAIPQSGSIGALDVEALRECIRPLRDGSEYLHAPELLIDSSGGRCDSFVVAAVAWVAERMHEAQYWPGTDVQRPVATLAPPVPRLQLLDMVSLTGPIALTLSTSDVADRIAAMARRWGATRVHGDQFGAWGWASELSKRGLRFEEHSWTAPTKNDAMVRLRQLIRDRILVVSPELGPEADAIVGEARTFVETITPSGSISFGARGRAHDDRIMTLLLAARVDTEGRLRGSPLRPTHRRHVIYETEAEAAEAEERDCHFRPWT